MTRAQVSTAQGRTDSPGLPALFLHSPPNEEDGDNSKHSCIRIHVVQVPTTTNLGTDHKTAGKQDQDHGKPPQPAQEVNLLPLPQSGDDQDCQQRSSDDQDAWNHSQPIGLIRP